MKQLTSVVTRKGQITLPREVRAALGLRCGDAVSIEIDGGVARLAPAGSVIARTAGALKGDIPALSPSEERDAFERGVAEEVMEEMRD